MASKRNLLKVVLLNALPASGKSEARKYLDSLSADECRSQFHLGETVQLDDYPYVHMMRRCDDELTKICGLRMFFQGPDKQFRNFYDWGTLVELLNEDFDDLHNLKNDYKVEDGEHGKWLLERMEKCRKKVNDISIFPSKMTDQDKFNLEKAIERDSKALFEEKINGIPDSLDDKTVVIEFARGGPDKSDFPLSAPLGYSYTYSRLSSAILKDTCILYLKVTPEISRQKNRARADPNDPGSIIFHGVPDVVMYGDYGCDDIEYLVGKSDVENTVFVKNKEGRSFHVPIGIFDNVDDKTTFARANKEDWSSGDVTRIQREMTKCFNEIIGQYGHQESKRRSPRLQEKTSVKKRRI